MPPNTTQTTTPQPTHHPSFVPPETATFNLSSDPIDTNTLQDRPHWIELRPCKGVALAYLHIFKAGGTLIANALNEFCNEATGSNAGYITGWRITSLDSICATRPWMCFTFYREPVSRFVSGYHEVMLRDHRTDRGTEVVRQTYPQLHIPEDSNTTTRLATFKLFLTVVEEGIASNGGEGVYDLNPHIIPQSTFLRRRGQHKKQHLATRGIAFFELSQAPEILERFVCVALASCIKTQHNNEHRPFVCPRLKLASSTSKKLRDRTDPQYGMKQYYISESELSDEQVTRISELYRDDYCLFGVNTHERATRPIKCM